MIERVRREIETWGKLSKKMKLGILVKKKDAMRLKKKKARQLMRKNQHIQMRHFLREQKERRETRKECILNVGCLLVRRRGCFKIYSPC